MSNYHCCVNLCTNDKRNENGKDKYFFNFPSKKEKKKEWIIAIKRDPGPLFKIKKNSTLVCSDHFKPGDIEYTLTGRVRLKQGAVPSIFKWTKEHEGRPDNSLQKFKKQKIEVESLPSAAGDITEMEQGIADRTDAAMETDSPYNTTNPETNAEVSTEINGEVSTETNAEINTEAESVTTALKEELASTQRKVKELELQIATLLLTSFGSERITGSPELTRFYTGFHSKEKLDSFYRWVEPYATKMTKWSQIQRARGRQNFKRRNSYGSFSLSLYDQLILFLIRLRLGLAETDLAVRFNITKPTVSRIIITWANFLYILLGQLPIWPTKVQIQNSMPECFKSTYPKTRVILDCTEIKVQRPSSKVLNSEFYSSYKSHTTYKCLIGIAPHGPVTFVSSLYQGSISDKEITRSSGILSLIEEGDEVMVDKGFLIQDLLQCKKATVTIPPFLSKTKSMQFSTKQVSETQQIARLRIHVERAIRRVKEYQIFDKVLPLSLAGSINQIWCVCCLMTNLRGALF